MVADQVQTGLREKGKGASCVRRPPAFILIPGIAENFLLPASPSFSPPSTNPALLTDYSVRLTPFQVRGVGVGVGWGAEGLIVW